MGKIVAIGGGEVRNLETLAIDSKILELSGVDIPKVLFLPTASEDAEEYIESFERVYIQELGADATTLRLWVKKPSKEEVRVRILESDVIYVGGGDVEKMFKKWKDEKDTYGISFKIENNDGSEWWKIKSNNKSNKIELINSNNDKIETPIDFHFRDDDMLQIGLSSSENGDFSLFIYSTATNYSFYSEAKGKNIENLNKIRVGALK